MPRTLAKNRAIKKNGAKPLSDTYYRQKDKEYWIEAQAKRLKFAPALLCM
jgi:hypothetical protein